MRAASHDPPCNSKVRCPSAPQKRTTALHHHHYTQYPLRIDAGLYINGASHTNVVLSGKSYRQHYRECDLDQRGGLHGVGNTLTKTAAIRQTRNVSLLAFLTQLKLVVL